MLETVDWESRSRPQATQGPEKGHGRIETRRIDTFCPAAGPVALLPCETSLPSTRNATSSRGRHRQLRLRHHLGRPAAGRRRPVAGTAATGHREPQPLPPRHGLRRRPEPDSYPSWAANNATSPTPRSRSSSTRIRQRAGSTLSAAPGGRAGRSSPTEPGDSRDRAGPAGPMPALHWACKAQPGSRHLQTALDQPVIPPNSSTSLTHSWSVPSPKGVDVRRHSDPAASPVVLPVFQRCGYDGEPLDNRRTGWQDFRLAMAGSPSIPVNRKPWIAGGNPHGRRGEIRYHKR